MRKSENEESPNVTPPIHHTERDGLITPENKEKSNQSSIAPTPLFSYGGQSPKTVEQYRKPALKKRDRDGDSGSQAQFKNDNENGKGDNVSALEISKGDEGQRNGSRRPGPKHNVNFVGSEEMGPNGKTRPSPKEKKTIIQKVKSVWSSRNGQKKHTATPVNDDMNDFLECAITKKKESLKEEEEEDEGKITTGFTYAMEDLKNAFTEENMNKSPLHNEPGVTDKSMDNQKVLYKQMRNFKTTNEEGYLNICEKNDFEKLRHFNDNYPLFRLRKKLNYLRIWVSYICRLIAKNPIFEFCSLIVITINSVFLAFERFDDKETPAFVDNSDNAFLYLYTAEMALNILGNGFIFNKGAYLRDSWNILDFVIVVSAWIPLVFETSSFSLTGLRSLRVLRPLKTITSIHSLKNLIQTVIEAIPTLVDILVVLLFVFAIFAIGGLQLFSGLLKQRCVKKETGEFITGDELCGNDDCSYGYVCGETYLNPNWGVTNFDNIFSALLMVFQIVTMEGWADIMLYLQQSFTSIVMIYFIVLIFIGSFFLLNLLLATIIVKYNEKQAEDGQKTADFNMQERQKEIRRLKKQKDRLDAKGNQISLSVLKKKDPERYSRFSRVYHSKKKMTLIKSEFFLVAGIKKLLNLPIFKFNKLGNIRAEEAASFLNLPFGNKIPQTSFPTQEESPPFQINKKNSFARLISWTKSGSSLVQNEFGTDNLMPNFSAFAPGALEIKPSVIKISSNLNEIIKNPTRNSLKSMNKVGPDRERPSIASLNEEVRGEARSSVDFIKSWGQGEDKPRQKISGNLSQMIRMTLRNEIDENDDLNRKKSTHNSSDDEEELFFEEVFHGSKHRKSKKITRGRGSTRNENEKFILQNNFIEEINNMSNKQQKKMIKKPRIRTEISEDSPLEEGEASREYKINERMDSEVQLLNSPKNREENVEFEQNQEQEQVAIIKDIENGAIGSVEFNRETSGLNRGFKVESETHENGETPSNLYPTFKRKATRRNVKKVKISLTKIPKDVSLSKSHSSESDYESFSISDDDQKIEDLMGKKEEEQAEAKRNDSEDEDSQKKFRDEPHAMFTKRMLESQYKKRQDFIMKKDLRFDEDFDSAPQENKPNQKKPNKKKMMALTASRDKRHSTLVKKATEVENDMPIVINLEERLHKKNPHIYKGMKRFDTQSSGASQGKRPGGRQDIQRRMSMRSSQSFNKGFAAMTQQLVAAKKKKGKKLKEENDDPEELAFKELMKNDDLSLKLTVEFAKEFTPHPRYDSQNDVLEEKQLLLKKKIEEDKENLVKASFLRMIYKSRSKGENQNKERKKNQDGNSPVKSSKMPSTFGVSGKSSIKGSEKFSEATLNQRDSVTERSSYTRPESNIEASSASLISLTNKMITEKPKIHNLLSLGPTYRTHFYERESLREDRDSKSTEESRKISRIQSMIVTRKIIDYSYGDAVSKYRELMEQEEEEWVPTHACNIKLLYNAIREKDLKQKAITLYNWSGGEVSVGIYHSKMTRVFNSLNSQTSEMWERGLLGLINSFRRKLVYFVESTFIDYFLNLCVFCNTILLAMDGLVSDDYQSLLDDMNDIFTLIFFIELVIKLTGLGPKRYVNDPFNIFDGVIVIISVIDYFVGADGGSAGALTAFRSFRVLRVTRVLRTLKYMMVIVDVISSTLQEFAYISLLLFLFIFIYSLLGMQLWGGKFVLSSTYHQNYDNFTFAFLSAFQILSVENWNDILYLAFTSGTNKFLSAAYFVSWIFIGNFILLNLFLAILLQGFTSDDVHQQLLEMEDENEEIDTFNKKLQEEEKFNREKEKEKHNLDLQEDGENEENDNKGGDSRNQESGNQQPDPMASYRATATKDRWSSMLDHEYGTRSVKSFMTNSTIKKSQRKAAEDPFFDVICETSLFFFSKKNKFRRVIASVVSHRYFDRTIIVLIILNSVQLVLNTWEDEQNPDAFMNNLSTFFQVNEYVFNSLFFFEMVFKILKYGFIFCQGTYLRDSWNQIDFFIVMASLFDMAYYDLDIGFIRVLRMLRTLRPLRFISHNQNMKIVVNSLLNSFSAIMNVFVVIFFIWLIFGILGISLMSEKMGYCDWAENEYGISNVECCRGASSCDSWKTYYWNFDNIFNSLQTLFVVSTLEAWPDMMYTALDSNDADEGPKENGNVAACIFYLVFVFVGSFFLVNLFVGVIFMQYNEEQLKEKRKRFKNWTTKQIEWVKLIEIIVKAKPNYNLTKPPNNWALRKIYALVNSNLFEIFIMVCIVVNIACLGMTFEGEPDYWTSTLDYINTTFTVIFILEAVLKLVGLGLSQYFLNPWNIFDFLIVLGSIGDILIDLFSSGLGDLLTVGPQLIRVIRVSRVTRLFKLMKSKKLEQIKKILNTLFYSFPSLLNVLVLLALVYFVYSVLGVFLFKYTDYSAYGEEFFNEYYNFDNFINALILLFRCSTGENWHRFMYILKEEHDDYYVLLFFLSYIVLTTFIIINLFMLVVVQEFEENFFNSENVLNMFSTQTDGFRKVWNKYTAHSRGTKIKSTQIFKLFQTLPYPYGFRKVLDPLDNFADAEINQDLEKMELEERRDVIANRIRELMLPVDGDGCIPFGIVLLAANKNAFGGFDQLELEPSNLKDVEIVKKILKKENKAKANIMKRELSKKLRAGKKRNQGELHLKSANPFITIMYSKMTFLALKKYTENNYKMILYHKNMGMSLKNIDPSSESSASSGSSENNSDEFEDVSPMGSSPESSPSKKELERMQDRNSILMERVTFDALQKEKEKMVSDPN